MKEISNETRRRKADKGLSDVERFDRWVSEYAEAHGMTKEEVVNLAVFRLENENIINKN